MCHHLSGSNFPLGVGGVVRGTCPNRIFKSWIWGSTDWLLLKAHHTWWHSKWAPGLPLHAYTLWVCVCVFVCVITLSGFPLQRIMWMSHGSLFFLSLLLSFYPEADSGKRKAAIRVTERSAGIKTQIVFVFLAQSFPETLISWQRFEILISCFYFCNLNVVQYFAVYTMKKGIKFYHWQKSAPLIPPSKYWFLQ